MKAIAQQVIRVLFVSLLTTALVANAQAVISEPGDPVADQRSFDVGMYLGEQWKINLRLAVHRRGPIIITVKDPNNTILYREQLTKSTTKYWRKFDFNEAKPGVYQFEISDRHQTLVRRVNVVDLPAIDAQRYITYGPQIYL